MLNQTSEFRKDISCLRGLAVIIVVLNHFRIPGFKFGFIGVDIFFVISGYLITRILYKEYVASTLSSRHKVGSISLSVFYLRRFRRLFPAAFVVILLTNLISLFLFNFKEISSLQKDSGWAIGFFANVAFLRSGADYFNQNTMPSLLQHYWSLSIEEQFYFVWPLLFVAVAYFQGFSYRKYKIKFNIRTLLMIFVLSLLSYAFLLLRFSANPLDAYFSIFTRAWELGVGGFAGVMAYNSRKLKNLSNFERISLFVLPVLASSFFINENNWAWFIAIPVIATGFFLYNGEGRTLASTESFRASLFLSQSLAFFGRISYSLYLVHWPIYIFAFHLHAIDLLVQRIVLIIISVVAALVLWRAVETPFMKIPIKGSIKNDAKLFELLRTRKYLLFPSLISIVVFIGAVTYPDSTPKFYLNSELIAANDLVVLQKYADMEAQLAPTGGILKLPNSDQTQTEVSNTTNSPSGSFDDLQRIQLEDVRSAVNKSKLGIDEGLQLQTAAEDWSPFERSQCLNIDTIIPMNCDAGSRVNGAKKVGIIGDSKMGHLAEPIISYFSQRNWHVVPWVMTGCNLTNPINTNLRTHCKERSDWITKNVGAQNFDLIILAEYPGMGNIAKQKAFVKNLENNTSKLLVLMQSPTTAKPIECVGKDLTYAISCSQIPQDFIGVWRSYTSNFQTAFQSDKTTVLETYKWWCVDSVCPLSIDNVVATRDGSHLTYTFVKKIRPLIDAMLAKYT